jgi:ElaB/YqjD/DUF883 family membrane-anchored ribosome-binding protein
MADKKTVDKVKELLGGHVYAPLKEAAEKWLAEAEEKYGDKFDDVKEKGEKAWDKISDAAEKFSEKSIEANEKLTKAGEKVAELAEKAAPVVDGLKEKAAPKVEELRSKAAPVVDKVTELEFIKQLKAGIASVDEVIDTFSDPEVREKMGEEAAEQIKAHAEAIKAEGKKFCDCPACTKAREILKDLGVDIEAPEVEEAEAEEPAAEEPAADEPEAE